MHSANYSIAPDDPDRPDVRALFAVADAWYATLYPPESNHAPAAGDFSPQTAQFYTARNDEGVLLGTGAVFFCDGYAQIRRMFVMPKARVGGIGQRMLNVLENAAYAAGFRTIRLETGIRQPAAITLYRKAGYTETGPFGEYVEDVHALFMQRILP